MMKRVGSCLYVHKSNQMELFDAIRETPDHASVVVIVASCEKYFPNYKIIKYDKKNRTVSRIESPDWDISYEPIVGDSMITNIDTCKSKVIKGKTNPQVYHHRWMFVSDDYKGFDIQKAKERSELLFSIPSFNTKEVKSRIGYKDYWKQWCINNNVNIN